MSSFCPPTLKFDRDNILLIVTGAISAVSTASVVGMLKAWYPEWKLRVLLSDTAHRFVSRSGLEALIGSAVVDTSWTMDAKSPDHHRSLADWADLLLVMPASTAFVSKLALLTPDSKPLYVSAATRALRVIVPSVPPSIYETDTFGSYISVLQERGYCFAVARESNSWYTGETVSGGPADITVVLHKVALMLKEKERNE